MNSQNLSFRMNKIRFLLYVCFTTLFFCFMDLHANDSMNPQKECKKKNHDTNNSKSQPDKKNNAPLKKDKAPSGLSFFPIIGYSPENSLMLGVSLVYLYRLSDNSSTLSNIQPIAIYTLKNQYLVYLLSEFYWANDFHKIKSEISLSHMPETFYGIGNNMQESQKEDYDRNFFAGSISYQPRIWKKLRLGLGFDFEYSEVYNFKPSGILDTQNLTGEGVGFSSGFGIIANWDSRNHPFAPTTGGFYEFSAYFYNQAFGSDYDYNRYTFDIRRYFSIAPKHTIAVHSYMKINQGNVPFYRLALLGGPFIMRGIYEGRYRDKNQLSFQLDYRFMPIVWRFGMTAFVAVGDVANKVTDFKIGDFKTTGGVGFRFNLDKQNNVYMRIDLAMSEEGLSPYLLFHEAF